MQFDPSETFRRIVVASKKGRGVRLSVEETYWLAQYQPIYGYDEYGEESQTKETAEGDVG